MSVARTTVPSIRINDSKYGLPAKPTTYIVELYSKSTPEEKPIAYLLIQRDERQRLDGNDGSVFDAAIEITYTELIPSEFSWTVAKKGWFSACYTRVANEPLIKLTADKPYSSGYLLVEMEHLRGHRLGTYLMNEIVTWAKRWPDASILPIRLLEGQAYKENKDRRNRFYEQFGIEFDYLDSGKMAGTSRPMRAVQLVNIDSWAANIRELDLHGYMTFLLTERQKRGHELKGLQTQLESHRGYMARVRAAPFRWAFEQRFPNFIETVIKLILFSLLALIVVYAFR